MAASKVGTCVITPQTHYDDLPFELTQAEFIDYTRRSSWLIRRLVKSGELPHRRLGKRVLIPKTALLPQE